MPKQKIQKTKPAKTSPVIGVCGEAQLVSEKALADDAEQVEHADDGDQAGVLEQADEGVDDARDDQLQRLRQDDQPHLLPVAEAERIGALVLALRDRLQAAADHFGHVGRGEQGDADQRAQQLVEGRAGRQEQRQHDARHEQHGDQRHAAHRLDEDDGEHLQHGQLGTPPERQHDAERQRHRDADIGEHQRHQQAAPQRGLDMFEAEIAADQHEEGEDREDDEEQQRVEALARRARHQQRHQQRDEDYAAQDHAPALVDRIAAEHELLELGVDEGPAGAGPAVGLDAALRDRGADRAVRPGPHRLDERPVEQRRHDQAISSRPTTVSMRRRPRRTGSSAARPTRPRLAARAAAADGDHFGADVGDIGDGHLNAPPAPCAN